jgi:5'(3')-deoxyribonucleotidase
MPARSKLKLEEQPIAFDADGVLLDFLGSFAKAAHVATNRLVSPRGASYSLDLKFGLSNQEMQKTWEIFNSGGYWDNLSPLPGAIEAIDHLQSLGFKNIHIVTAIPEKFRSDRHANFRKLGFSPEAIHCVEHTSMWAKVPPITALRPFMFLDDRIEHLHANPQVPLLVHIDHNDEQFPIQNGRVDATVQSVAQWVTDFSKNIDYWREKIESAHAITTTTTKRQIRRRSPQ